MTDQETIDKLRGTYRIPITDGQGPAGGEEPDNADFFVRSFPTSPLALRAADVIERLRAENEFLRTQFEQLEHITTSCIKENDGPDRLIIDGVAYEGVAVDAYFAMIRLMQKTYRTILGKEL